MVAAVPLVTVYCVCAQLRSGATSFTVTVTVAVSLPPVLVAVMVYDAVVLSSLGVPEIVPSEVSNDKPPGKDGEMDQVTTSPPLTVGVTEVMAVPLVRVNVEGS